MGEDTKFSFALVFSDAWGDIQWRIQNDIYLAVRYVGSGA